jgi:hypothetical protein
MSKPIVLPVRGQRSLTKNRRVKKRPPGPVRLTAAFDPQDPAKAPDLVFRRRTPSTTWIVPAITTPLYWFDAMMLRKKLIVSIPPNTFIVDGRRFKVLAQDHKVIGVGYTRWLVYEEAAVPKGETP